MVDLNDEDAERKDVEDARHDQAPKVPVTEIFENFHLIDPEEERRQKREQYRQESKNMEEK